MSIARLAWVDIETTGLDPERDDLLELAIVVTDTELVELAHFSRVVRYVDDPATKNVVPVVIEMHLANGLWQECASVNALRRFEVEHEALQFLEREQATGGPMCGSSVHFDRGFLHKHMADFERRFHYRNLDTSSIGVACEHWAPRVLETRPGSAKRHRALDDARESIALMRHYRDALMLPAARARLVESLVEHIDPARIRPANEGPAVTRPGT